MPHDNLLIVADSDHDANMLFAVGMFVPDPFIYLRSNGRSYVVMSDLEIDRARKHARKCSVLSLTSCLRRLQKSGVKSPKLSEIVARVLRDRRVRKALVPSNFPLGLARELRALKIKLRVKENPFFPQRETKSAEEIKKISAALVMAEVGLSEGVQALKSAKIGKTGRLMYHNVPLTSEKLRAIIHTAVVQAGGMVNHTIVAGGAQACDPHEHGSGLLRANQPIILDVFPRSQRTGYFGDITRTVVKGRATDAVRKLYNAVARGQAIALEQIREGKRGSDVHQSVQKHFEDEGFKTRKRNGRMEGFFHGTGHGLGLDVHEPPRMSEFSEDTLRIGHVVTVEPGLYYPGIGGVRLEDVVCVTARAPRNLTKFEKVLEV